MTTSEYVQRVAMKAAIVRDNKVLLLREASTNNEGTQRGRWQMPGGRINPGEKWKIALKREVHEETNIKKFKIIKPMHVGEWFPKIKNVHTHIVAVYHLCVTDEKEVVLSNEHDAFQWVTAENWRELDVLSPEDKVLEHVFQEILAS